MQEPLDRLRAALAPGYTLDRQIGRGGMSNVYLARDARHGRPVAIKVLHAEIATEAAIARFLREVGLCARLTHPNIVPLLDSGAVGRQPWFSMPFLEGETLRARLEREGRLPVADVLTIGRDVADALDYAHAAGIIHRDIKPENLVLVGGRAMVLDFGVGRAIADADDETRMTSVGLVMGTPLYMSPEQAADDRQLDGRTDQYALALTLYEALVGEHPFRSGTVVATISRRFHETPARADARRPDVPPGLATALARALRVEPEARFPSMAAFRAALTADSGVDSGAIEIPSIAVLPFANVGGDPSDAFLAEGLTEEIITGLSRLRSLKVAARSSTFALRDGAIDVAAVAARLGVRTVLEGSVQRAGERVRVSTRLVQASDGTPFWATTFDRRLDDVFAIQDELSAAIVHTLKATLLGADAAPAPATPVTSAAAYERYLKGRYAWNSRTEDGLAQAIDHFLDAAALDPRYAPAYAGLGDAWAVLGTYGMRAPHDAFPRAREHAQRARALDPSLAEAWATLGLVAAAGDRDWARAADAFRRAITLAPGYPTAWQWRAVALHAPRGAFGEALADLARARAVDPLSLPVRVSEGIVLAFAGRVDEAIASHQATVSDLPDAPMARFFLGQALLQGGRPADAVQSLEAALGRVRATPEMLAVLAQARAALGETDRARALVDELIAWRERRYVSAALVAQGWLALGELGQATTWLDRAADEGDAELLYLGVRAAYAPLRTAAAFPTLLERAGLAAAVAA